MPADEKGHNCAAVARTRRVPGASQAIGVKVADAFRKLDYRIVETAPTIKAVGRPGCPDHRRRYRRPRTAQRVISESIARFGRIEMLVNNADIYIGKSFTEHAVEDIAAVTNANWASCYHFTQFAITEMET